MFRDRDITVSLTISWWRGLGVQKFEKLSIYSGRKHSKCLQTTGPNSNDFTMDVSSLYAHVRTCALHRYIHVHVDLCSCVCRLVRIHASMYIAQCIMYIECIIGDLRSFDFNSDTNRTAVFDYIRKRRRKRRRRRRRRRRGEEEGEEEDEGEGE